MADKKAPALPSLSGIQDPETRKVLQAIIDGLNVRYGTTQDQGAQFVTRDELEKFMNHGAWTPLSNIRPSFNALSQSTSSGQPAIGGVSQAFRGLVKGIIQEIQNSALWKDLTARIKPAEATATSAHLLGQQAMSVASNVDGTVLGSWTVKFDADGYVVGAGLGLEGKAGSYSSQFLVRADRFAIGSPSNTNFFPFIIDTHAGSSVIAMAGSVYIDASNGVSVADLTRPQNFLGAFSTAPSTVGLLKNTLYKNTTDNNTYIITTDAGTWQVFATGGVAGTNGTRTAILDMYQVAATTPTLFPSGSSTYTWATAQFTAPGTVNGWSLTPPAPVAGQNLYIARMVYADSNTTATSSVTWAVSTALISNISGSNGSNGSNGTRTAFMEMYLWAASTPSLFPSGSSTYTWSTGAFTAPSTPNGWSLTPGAATPGYTLYGCSVRYSDTGTSGTSSIAWSTSTAYTVGAAGSNGTNGARGTLTGYGSMYSIYASSWTDGLANRVIYNLINGTSLTTSLSTTTHLNIGDVVTLTNSSSATAVWTKYWGGTSWLSIGVVIDGNLLVNGSVSTASLAAGTITATVSLQTSGGYVYAGGSSGYADTVNTLGYSASVCGRNTSSVGYGVLGINTTGTGVAGFCSSGGTAVLASSSAGGTALNVLGNTVINGGDLTVYAVAITGAAANYGLSINSRIYSSLATGTPPIAVTSTTQCTNLNAAFVNNIAFQGPTTGSALATFVGTNKPGAASSNQWVPCVNPAGTIIGYLPLWT